MSSSLSSAALLGTVSKHATAGIIAIVIGALAFLLGLVKTAVRTVMLLVGVGVVVIGILLATRTI